MKRARRAASRIAGRRITVRRIAVVTGTRAEFGLLESTLAALRDFPNVRTDLLVGGMHLLPRFGRTERLIRSAGWTAALRVPMQRGDDRPDDQARGLARGVDRMAAWMVRARPDIVLVLGDRIEALAGALAGALTGRIVAHVHGGDRAPGDLDDSIRHAITRVAHLHLVASEDAARRIRRMGEPGGRIVQVGAPGLDALREMLGGPHRPVKKSDTALVAFHPVGRPPAVEQRAMKQVLNAAARTGLHLVIVYPNSDRGSSGVQRAIHEFAARAGGDHCTLARSMARADFLRALCSARVLIGNSSAGLIEAPFAGTPAVDVGDRQKGRLRGGRWVFSARETARSLDLALRRALWVTLAAGRRGPYGDGRAGERIARVLATRPLDSLRGPKLITF